MWVAAQAVSGLVLNPLSWRQVAIRYTGGTLNAASSWRVDVDGAACGFTTFSGTPTTTVAGSEFFFQSSANSTTTWLSAADLSIWSGTRLSDAQLLALRSVALGRARFARLFASAGTVRGIELPGGLTRTFDGATESRDTKVYLSLDGVAWTEVKLGEDPAFAVPAGSTLYLDIELTHLIGESLPFIGDSTGLLGPVVVYEEADPPAPPTYSAALEEVPFLNAASAVPVVKSWVGAAVVPAGIVAGE
jgi:hypothetical protein